MEDAVAAGLALNCRINQLSRFDRKHYFYADSPAGYQITQRDVPIAENGYLDYLIDTPQTHSATVARATIQRIQIEQDTGKSLHDEKHSRVLVDLNRAGTLRISLPR